MAVRLKSSIRLTPTERAMFKRAGEVMGISWQQFLRSAAVEKARRVLQEYDAAPRIPEDPRQRSFGSLLEGADRD